MLSNLYNKVISYTKNTFLYLNSKKIISTLILLSIFSSKTYALTLNETNVLTSIIDKLITDTMDWILLGGGALIAITAILRVVSEYMKGGSKYRFYDIGKYCIIALLMLFILPFLPGFIESIVNKYISLQ